jgi:hypothetical protein
MALGWRPLLNLGLMALLVGLASVGLTLAWPRLTQAPPTQAGGEQNLAGSQMAAAPGRDLFAPPEGLGPQTPREAMLEVLGVVISPRETMALVRYGAAIKRLHPGESVGRYRLREVRSDRLILQETRGGTTKEVLIKKEFAVPEPKKSK